MIEEAYCSFEVAKLLKEKEFDWECEHVIWEGVDNSYENYDKAIPNPTHQMAMKWLREVHGLSVEIFSIKGTSNICPVFWKGNVVKLLTQDRVFSGELVGSYEEAVEAALKYVLKNLI